jgi:hypothetical protein
MEFNQLIQKPEFQRDDRWEEDFLNQFTQLKVQIESDQAKQGPDGWPYLFVKTSGAKATEPVPDVVRWLAGRGIGMAVNTHKMLPDYVFPYGMLWNYVETGRFQRSPVQVDATPEARQQPALHAGEAVYSSDQKPLVGPPSEKYLPPYVRGIMKEFLRAQGFISPRVVVISSPDFSAVDLVFSLDSLGMPPRSEHQKLADRLAWFLPLHYTLVLGEEKGLPPFHPL